ncbi:MAG: hypothetical protein E7200_00455 [Selenomonas ruminantium]|nr:hypothetical protein [Selenomonas ruminantium]
MFLLEDELQYEGDIDYEKSLFELAACYDCGAVMERKVFSYDAENQQWLEGVDLKPEAEKEPEKIQRTGDAYWFLPCRWTVEARETGVVAVSLQLYNNCVGGYSSGVVGAGFRLGRDILADLKFLLLFAIIYEGKGAGDCSPLQNS